MAGLSGEIFEQPVLMCPRSDLTRAVRGMEVYRTVNQLLIAMLTLLL